MPSDDSDPPLNVLASDVFRAKLLFFRHAQRLEMTRTTRWLRSDQIFSSRSNASRRLASFCLINAISLSLSLPPSFSQAFQVHIAIATRDDARSLERP